MAVRFLVATVLAMAVVSVWVPFLGRQIETRWFSWPNIAFLAPIPLITAYVAYRLFRDLEEGRHVRPFFLAIGLFLLGYLGLGDQPLPLHRAAEPHDLGHGQHRQFAALRPGGLRHRAADDLRLHGLLPTTSSAARWRRRSQAAATDITDAGRNASSPVGAALETAPLVRVHLCREPRGLHRRSSMACGRSFRDDGYR